MTTVREVVHDLLRHHGLTTIFGNPGSNELPFLDQWPDDFMYVVGLHEGVALAMADGFAQATGRAAFVNLHSAAGLGNAMGNLANARASGTPLVITAGQQSRGLVGLGSVLGEPDMVKVPEPQVKWSFEPATASDVPRAISQAIHLAQLPPAGPVFVSVPLDDWGAEVDPARTAPLLERSVMSAGRAEDAVIDEIAGRLQRARSGALVLGPEVDRPDVRPALVALAEHLDLSVHLAPTPPRCPFPTRHPLFAGVLPPSVAGVRRSLEGHDLVLALGAPVFRYHANLPDAWLPEGTRLLAVTGDPAGAARAPFGDAIVGDPGAVAVQLAAALEAGLGDEHGRRGRATAIPDVADSRAPFEPGAVIAQLLDAFPAVGSVVAEVTSCSAHIWARLDNIAARRYFFPAAGGLGFGLPAAVGVALADRSHPVLALLGDGAVQYGVVGLWNAVQLDLPVTFVVLDNGSYGALRGFESLLGVSKVPGLELPGLDAAAIAAAYGMDAVRIEQASDLTAVAADLATVAGPRLVTIPVVTQPRAIG